MVKIKEKPNKATKAPILQNPSKKKLQYFPENHAFVALNDNLENDKNEFIDDKPKLYDFVRNLFLQQESWKIKELEEITVKNGYNKEELQEKLDYMILAGDIYQIKDVYKRLL